MCRCWTLVAVVVAAVSAGLALRADDEPKNAPKPASAKPDLDKPSDLYTLPEGADVEGLMKFVKEIQSFRPKTRAEALAHQRQARIAMQGAARRILSLEKDTKSE